MSTDCSYDCTFNSQWFGTHFTMPAGSLRPSLICLVVNWEWADGAVFASQNTVGFVMCFGANCYQEYNHITIFKDKNMFTNKYL